MSVLDNAKTTGTRILIKPDEKEDKSAGGIIIVEEAQERPQFGEVILVGDEVKNTKVGNRVMHGKYAGTEVEIEDETFLIMREDDLLLIYT